MLGWKHIVEDPTDNYTQSKSLCALVYRALRKQIDFEYKSSISESEQARICALPPAEAAIELAGAMIKYIVGQKNSADGAQRIRAHLFFKLR